MASKFVAICCVIMLISHEIQGSPITSTSRPVDIIEGSIEETYHPTPTSKSKNTLKYALTGAAVGAAVLGAAAAGGVAYYQHTHKNHTTVATATGAPVDAAGEEIITTKATVAKPSGPTVTLQKDIELD